MVVTGLTPNTKYTLTAWVKNATTGNLTFLGLDPATSSAPFVATLVDVTGLVIYFTVAQVVLHGTLL
jgi:cation transporter-like permease